MMIDLKDLKDNFNLEAVFNLGPPKEFVGKLDSGKDILDRIDLVLTQTFDAIGTLPFRQLIVKGKGKKVIIIYYRNNFLGIVTNENENVENILKYIYEKGSLKTEVKTKEKQVKKTTVEKKERVKPKEEKREEVIAKEKEAEEEKRKEELAKAKALETEKVEEKPEEIEKVSVSKVTLSPKIIEDIEKIAGNYLGDFSLDIVSNVIEDSGINREEPSKDQVLEVAQSLKDAASLIIGPSKAKKLKEDIVNKIEEAR